MSIKLSLVVVFVVGILTCFAKEVRCLSPTEDKQKKFRLKGLLKGLPSGSTLYLVYNKLNGGGVDTLQQSRSGSNGDFSFSGQLPYEGLIYFIKIKNLDSLRERAKTAAKYIKVALESKVLVDLEGELDDLSIYSIRVKGSLTHYEYMSFMLQERGYADLINQLSNDIRKKLTTGQITSKAYSREREEKIVPLENEYLLMRDKWISDHPSSYFTPWIIMNLGYEDLFWVENHCRGLTDKALSGYYGRQLQKRLQILRSLSIGAVAPNFNFSTHEGNKTSLHKIAASGRYTIIDFWASWCSPCRAAFPKLKALYATYKDKGLNIIGYSTDKNETDWENAIEQEQLPWYNLMDKDNFFARNRYGIVKLPTYFIIDNECKIAAAGIYGANLIAKIKELMGDGKVK